MIDVIMGISGIEKYDASAQPLVSTNLAIFPGNVPLKGDINNKVYARTVAGTEDNSFFQSGVMELAEGNHIMGNEGNAAVISKDMAEQNNLKIGDPISLKADEETEVKIIGIYEILKPDPVFESIVTYEKLENQIFIDIDTLQNLFGDDTVLKNYPLYCPKCKQETLIEAKNLKVTVIREPDAKAQSREKNEETRFAGFCIFVNMKKF